MSHRKWRETKQQPGTAGPGNMLGCCLVSLHFLCYILCSRSVDAPQCRTDKIRAHPPFDLLDPSPEVEVHPDPDAERPVDQRHDQDRRVQEEHRDLGLGAIV